MAIQANITLEGVQLTWEQDNMTKKKIVSLPDFARTLLQQVGLTVGPLPLHPNARGVRYIKQSDGLYIFVEDPPRPMPVRFKDNEFNIIAPRSVWQLKVVGASTGAGKLQDVRVYALAEPLTHTSVTCFQFPFCNTYQDGRICWGGNKGIMIERQFVELIEIPDIYWSSGFSGEVDPNMTVMVAGEECHKTEAFCRKMHETGEGIDPDSFSNPVPFATILERTGGNNV